MTVLCLTFPVAMFWAANQAARFEDKSYSARRSWGLLRQKISADRWKNARISFGSSGRSFLEPTSTDEATGSHVLVPPIHLPQNNTLEIKMLHLVP